MLLQQCAQNEIHLHRQQGTQVWIDHGGLFVQCDEGTQIRNRVDRGQTRKQLQVAFVGPLSGIFCGSPPILIEYRLAEHVGVTLSRFPPTREQHVRKVV
ncbi:hypothetical protein [Nocardia carnea]|uniref:hypothetical protein n=1 Tax=Nocardia carnea TaxID=37328 RepID=UPI00245667A8|nr:hypothetical protein [Nocardia carnea]